MFLFEKIREKLFSQIMILLLKSNYNSFVNIKETKGIKIKCKNIFFYYFKKIFIKKKKFLQLSSANLLIEIYARD